MDKSHYFSIKPNTKLIHIPDWNEEGYIRIMSGQERAAWFDAVQKDQDIIAKLVCLTLSTEDGKRIFSDEDLEAVKGLSSIALDAIFKASLDFNLLTRDSITAEKKD